jgi:hypothetical protein
MKSALSALLIAATAGLLPMAAANATTATVATDAAALKAAEVKLVSVLGSYAATPAWTAQYNVAEAAVKTAQAALTQAIAAATPPKPLAWHEVEQQTSTGTYEQGVRVNTLTTPGYYTGQFKATVHLSGPPPKVPASSNPPLITWQVYCTAIYGLASGSNSGNVTISGSNGSANFIIPAHMRDCEASASYYTYGNETAADATRTLSATLTLFASGNIVSSP